MDTFIFPNNKTSLVQRQKRRDKRMAEELIECRRYGGGDINKKIRQKGDARRRQQKELTDGFSVQEPINLKKSTSFSDNLEPLERFLRSNIGQPWSEVYSKLSRNLDRTTVSGEHVFQHLNGYVNNPRFNNNLLAPKTYGIRNDGSSTRLGIHPKTGLLCIINPKSVAAQGPFPRKARFKKAKQRRKVKLRLGIEEKAAPVSSATKPQDLVRAFVYRLETEQEGIYAEYLRRRTVDFWMDNQHIILNFTRLYWAPSPVLNWKNMVRSVPACYLHGRIWIKSAQTERPHRVTFQSIWDRNIQEMMLWQES